MNIKTLLISLCLLTLSIQLAAEDVIELDTTTIKGNTELPKYLYVVPWQDKQGKRNKERKLKLHNLYGDLFDPVMPDNNLIEELPVLEVNSG